MITLLASLLGFISSMFPSFIKLWQDKSDKQHELRVLELQIEADKKRAHSKLEAINAYSDIEASKALYKTYQTGVSWVDAFNGTVRPAVAYGIFLALCSDEISNWINHGLKKTRLSLQAL